MITKNNIILQLYSDAVVVFNKAGTFTAKDKDGKAVTIDMDAVNTEFNKQKYKNERTYPSLADQLDMQYWDKKNGTTTWVDAIAKVKSDNPKS